MSDAVGSSSRFLLDCGSFRPEYARSIYATLDKSNRQAHEGVLESSIHECCDGNWRGLH